jgi:NTE family protein
MVISKRGVRHAEESSIGEAPPVTEAPSGSLVSCDTSDVRTGFKLRPEIRPHRSDVRPAPGGARPAGRTPACQNALMPTIPPTPRVAFVLGGGGVLGATQVGMLRALLEAGVRPSLVVGTSVGALNGAAMAADPSARGVEMLAALWTALSDSGMFSGSLLSQAGRLARHRTHLHSAAPLRRLLGENLPERIEDLAVPFQCVAASIERATAHWFSTGPLADAVLASCAVPGLLPPVEIGGEHFLDGGLVHSIPVGRALALGATEIYVLHVGRIERPLVPPKSPWDLGLVAFEIARRHRFVEEMSTLPPEVRAHVLPSGEDNAPLISLRYRSTADVASRVERGYQATAAYLAGLPAADAAGGRPAAGANGRPAAGAGGRPAGDAGRPAADEGG